MIHSDNSKKTYEALDSKRKSKVRPRPEWKDEHSEVSQPKEETSKLRKLNQEALTEVDEKSLEKEIDLLSLREKS